MTILIYFMNFLLLKKILLLILLIEKKKERVKWNTTLKLLNSLIANFTPLPLPFPKIKFLICKVLKKSLLKFFFQFIVAIVNHSWSSLLLFLQRKCLNFLPFLIYFFAIFDLFFSQVLTIYVPILVNFLVILRAFLLTAYWLPQKLSLAVGKLSMPDYRHWERERRIDFSADLNLNVFFLYWKYLFHLIKYISYSLEPKF